jgi:xanthine dehydrogenase small subunit
MNTKAPMRDHVVLTINGIRHTVRAPDAFLSLSDFLRNRLGLTGTKIVCSEGDCGACTTLIGRAEKRKAESGKPSNGKAAPDSSALGFPLSALTYRPIDSCIQFLFQLDGAHIVSVEGLRPDGELNAVQQAMIDCHGSQCGFCTPGFVMAMTGMLEADAAPADADWRRGLTGNLCRCTGYTPILDAAIAACEADHERLNVLYPPAQLRSSLEAATDEPIELTHTSAASGQTQRVFCPRTLEQTLAFLAENPDARIVAGATDIGVRTNKSGRLPTTIVDLNRIEELTTVEVTDGVLTCGARASWTSLLAACETAAPEFARILSVFGAPQIRHVGTIGGNIANGSPIADSLPFLYVTEATLVLASHSGRREVNINDFFRGYKLLDLNPGELIAEVRIPLPVTSGENNETLRLYKVSRRKDLDISTFTAAIRLRLSADTIRSASIAFGGVGPTVLRARKTEEYLIGQPFTEATMTQAAELAASEVTPITDVRGEANYRRQLTKNILLKFYYQQLAPTLAAS